MALTPSGAPIRLKRGILFGRACISVDIYSRERMLKEPFPRKVPVGLNPTGRR